MYIRSKISLLIISLSFLISSIFCKRYSRCEFINELKDKFKFEHVQASNLSCAAGYTNYDTSKTGEDWETEDTWYGIFRIKSEEFCSTLGVGGKCNINCNDLIDDDISDDVACLRKVIPDFSTFDVKNDSYGLWSDNYCEEKPVLCDFKWESLRDCQKKFVEIKDFGYCPAHGGRPALKHEFPHAAAIGWSKNNSKEIVWACGGSLITEDTILTAAHCTFGPNGARPHVVRLGDLNLITDNDARDTQQFEIKSIIRHPNYKSRYNDIALIKFRRKVRITKFVTPACLWSKHKIPIDVNLEACGFGQTEFGGDISPILNKIIVSPINLNECQEEYTGDRLLRNGLSDDIHLCAIDNKSDKRMDTCEGDSGGPLEMKLQYDDFEIGDGGNLYTIPFIVGVTAFGKSCGGHSPGVYTRVASYVDWIKSHVPELELDPLECSKLYKDKRTFKFNHYSTYGSYKVVLGEKAGEKSYAIIITDQYLLSTASALSNMLNPNRVKFALDDEIYIDKIIHHPKYRKGQTSYINDIALIKLNSTIRFFYKDFPTCLSRDSRYYDKTRSDQGHLPHYNLGIEGNHEGDLTFDQYLLGYYQTEVRNSEVHYNFAGFNNCFELGNVNATHLCFDRNVSYIPGLCEVPYGSPIFYGGDTCLETRQMITVALAVSSNLCGNTTAMNLSPYYDWIESVVFPSASRKKLSSNFFTHVDVEAGGQCKISEEELGICKDIGRCNHNHLHEFTTLCKNNTRCCQDDGT